MERWQSNLKVGILGSLGAAVAIAGLAGFLEKHFAIPKDLVRIMMTAGGSAATGVSIVWIIDLMLNGRKKDSSD